MDHVELLTIEACFEIERRGLVLVPDFPVPPGRWSNFQETVIVENPAGSRLEVTAQFNLSHFNIPDPKASIKTRWRIVVTLLEGTKQDISPGSKVLVSSRARNAVLIGNKA